MEASREQEHMFNMRGETEKNQSEQGCNGQGSKGVQLWTHPPHWAHNYPSMIETMKQSLRRRILQILLVLPNRSDIEIVVVESMIQPRI